MKFHRRHLALIVLTACAACADSEQQNAEPVVNLSDSVPDKAETAVFDQLDTDQNGFINAIEAIEDSALMEKWISLDANSDRKIDRSEFAKLEAKQDQNAATEAPATESQDVEQNTAQPQQTDANY